MGDEEEAAPAVADAGILALEPGRMVNTVFRAFAGFMRVFEWIFDHGDRDLSYRRCSCSN
ncbi:hypothetical protein QFZ36_000145 [Pseudarthrobacter siccitolerans]|uniref:Uncharacterized protein n=1 Tax=Pseudarthrobacter siccitolerans TaxID=861266 RepID=A0ABU0PF45_9MICC|nr:hypothetical protein [Pseudarthrobacter siccitolerans]MDQ0672584.1 hypothetical protein [Pseudarthrobacter siccitolerans]